MDDLTRHLLGRIKNINLYLKVIYNSWIDYESNNVYFYLWNYSGQWVGYQKYNYTLPNEYNKNHPTMNRYYTYLPRQKIGVFGLDYCRDLRYIDNLYVTEGVFDCLSVMSLGYDCIAVLSNNPKKYKSWLSTLPCNTIAVCDGDNAGKKLQNCCDRGIILPEGEDANSINREDLKGMLNEN